jgi:hypothetical protein
MVDPDNIEWIPFAIALDMVEAAGCTANPRRFLWNALRQKHIRAGQPPFEGGPDPLFHDTSYTPDKYSERDREGLTIVDRFSLMRYLNPPVNTADNLSAVSSPRLPKRPSGRNLVLPDAPIVAQMREMVLSGRATGSFDAAGQILRSQPDLVKGKGVFESLRTRLTKRYRKTFGE